MPILLFFLVLSCIDVDVTIHTTKTWVEDSFKKELEVEEPLTLELETISGDVTVTMGKERKLKVLCTFQVSTGEKEEAEKIAEKIKADPPIEVEQNKIRIGNLQKYKLRPSQRVNMDFQIEAPYNTSVNARSGSGDHRIENIKGPVLVKTGSGDIKIKDISEKVDVETGNGDIKISGVSGSVDAGTGSGDLVLETVGGDVSIQTGSGDIIVDSPIGDARWSFNTGSGDITLKLPAGSEFNYKARTGSGDIEIGFASTTSRQTRGELEGKVGEKSVAEILVETGSGDIEIKKG